MEHTLLKILLEDFCPICIEEIYSTGFVYRVSCTEIGCKEKD